MVSWADLPEVILANIFSHLPVLDRLRVGKVCRNWYISSQRAQVWRSFTYSEDEVWLDLMCHMSDEQEISMRSFKAMHSQIDQVVRKYGKYFNHLCIFIKGEESFRIFSLLVENCQDIWYLDLGLYTVVSGKFVNFKTNLYSLFKRCKNMREVRVDGVDFRVRNDHLPITMDHMETMTKLWLVNSFRSNSFSNLMYLVSLKVLGMNPNALNYSLLHHLASNSLCQLDIVANSKTKDFYNEALQDVQWKEIRKQGPKLKVNCYLAVNQEWTEKEVFLKPSMPVKSLVYGKNLLLNYDNLAPLMANYRDTLEEFIDFSMCMNFYDIYCMASSIETSIIQIVQSCPRLHTFAVKELLSSSGILVLAYINPNWRNLMILEDRITYTNDVPNHAIPEGARAIVRHGWKRDNFLGTMKDLLGYDWKPLPTAEYTDILLTKYSTFF